MYDETMAAEGNPDDTAVAQYNQALDRYVAAIKAFQGTHPDHNDAYQFFINARNKHLQAAGVDDPVERTSMMQFEEGALVGRALRNGKDPAEMIYNLARALGFKGLN